MLWIVKLGGSLAAGAPLREWLDVLAAHGGGRCVIVPGGGPFADAVRATQCEWGFDDASAHRMALLAMVQYGLMLSALEPRLQPAASKAELTAALASGAAAVWLPVPMALDDPAIEMSWRVTSDSLALWLAQRLNAARVVLVKSVTVASTGITELSAAGVVDAAFAEFAARSGCEIYCLGPEDTGRLAQALVYGSRPAVPLTR
jgi:aspartokinase-like uncharacterized kinase